VRARPEHLRLREILDERELDTARIAQGIGEIVGGLHPNGWYDGIAGPAIADISHR
jgi:hypothetical protein